MKNIKNNPKINEVITNNENDSYYNGLIDKNERLKSEKNYLLNYLANLNINIIEKNPENASKKLPLNPKREKEEDLKKLSDDINILNSKIEKIEGDINLMNETKKINSDKYNKVNISLFIQSKNIDEQNKINKESIKAKKEKEKLINKYSKENINLDSLILKQNLKIKEDNLKKEETLTKLDKEISISQLQIDNKELILNNLKGIYKNLNEENEHKNKIKNEFEKIKVELENKKSEKTKKIEELNNENNKIINKSKKIKEEILDKNSKFDNFKKNLSQYNEYSLLKLSFYYLNYLFDCYIGDSLVLNFCKVYLLYLYHLLFFLVLQNIPFFSYLLYQYLNLYSLVLFPFLGDLFVYQKIYYCFVFLFCYFRHNIS